MVATFTLGLVIFIIFLALVFDFTNGFHDSANSIATVVSTKVLSPKKAVLLAAFFNFIAAIFITETATKILSNIPFVTVSHGVANTISKYLILDEFNPDYVPYVVLAGLIGAIGWNLTTWFLGLPTSSSHALMGGLTGAGIVAGGLGAINPETIQLVVIFMVVSPILGFIFGFIFMAITLWICRSSSQVKVDHWFKKLQLVSASAYSFSHGTNDAQKTIGVIIFLLAYIGYSGVGSDPNNLQIPWWVILAAFSSIALGTLLGGWRIIKTMGNKITRLRPVHGFSAETGGFVSIMIATVLGIPVSTTHIICSSIMGVGATRRLSAVRWGVARSIVAAWIFTIPAAGIIGAISFFLIRLFL